MEADASQVRHLTQSTRARVDAKQVPVRIKVAELEVYYERKLTQEREQQRFELAHASLEWEFRGMAAKRATKAPDWSDSGSHWKATPHAAAIA